MRAVLRVSADFRCVKARLQSAGSAGYPARAMDAVTRWIHVLALAVYLGSTLAIALVFLPAAGNRRPRPPAPAAGAWPPAVQRPLDRRRSACSSSRARRRLTDLKAMLGAGFGRLLWPLLGKLALTFVLIDVATYLSFGLAHRLVRAELGSCPSSRRSSRHDPPHAQGGVARRRDDDLDLVDGTPADGPPARDAPARAGAARGALTRVPEGVPTMESFQRVLDRLAFAPDKMRKTNLVDTAEPLLRRLRARGRPIAGRPPPRRRRQALLRARRQRAHPRRRGRAHRGARRPRVRAGRQRSRGPQSGSGSPRAARRDGAEAGADATLGSAPVAVALEHRDELRGIDRLSEKTVRPSFAPRPPRPSRRRTSPRPGWTRSRDRRAARGGRRSRP